MWFRRRCSGIALDIGRASVSACQVARNRRGLTLCKWGAVEDPLRERPSGDELSDTPVERTTRLVRQLGFRGRDLLLALKPPDVSFLTVTVPDAISSASPEQLLNGLRFEAARELRCDPSSLVVDGWPLPRGNRSGENYMITAIPQTAAARWSSFADSIGMILRRIEVLPSALLRAAWRDGRQADDALWGVLDLGCRSCVLALAKGPHCVYVRQLSINGDCLTQSICDSLGVDYAAAEMLKREYRASPDTGRTDRGSAVGDRVPQSVHSLLRSHIKTLAGELERAFGYAMETYPDLSPTALYLSGSGTRLSGLRQTLRERLGIDVELLNPCDGLDVGWHASSLDEGSHACIAASVGLAIGDVE